MKLLTLNCHSWQEENQLDKIAYLAHTIKDKAYDVIALQEVSQRIPQGKPQGDLQKDNFAKVLLSKLEELEVRDYKLVWDYSHIGYDIYEEGLCILSKHPIINQESFFVSQIEDRLNWKARKIVKITVEYDKELIDFYSCHIGWWHDKEEPAKNQIMALQSKLSTTRRSFIMGDFNNDAAVLGEGYDYIKSLGWLDTYELAKLKDDGYTVKGKIDGWKSNASDLRLDYIFTTQPVQVNKSYTLFNGQTHKIISDHYGVEVELSL